MDAAIHGRDVGCASHIAVHHAKGDAHIANGSVGSHRAFVLAHDASGIAAAAHVGKIVAVHHAHRRASLNQPDETTRVGASADAAAPNAAVVNLGAAFCRVSDGAHIAAAAVSNATDDNILDHGIFGHAYQRMTIEGKGIVIAVDLASEWGFGRADGRQRGEPFEEDIAAIHVCDFT